MANGSDLDPGKTIGPDLDVLKSSIFKMDRRTSVRRPDSKRIALHQLSLIGGPGSSLHEN